MKRVPLWLTLVPLVLGGLVWFFVWGGYRDGFRAELQRALPGADIDVGGFPYRLQAKIAQPRLGVDLPGLTAGGEAQAAVVNRVPWKADHLVINLEQPIARIRVNPLLAAQGAVRAAGAQVSLHRDRRAERRVDGRASVARLSAVWSDATLTTALLPATLNAPVLETHFREIVGETAPASGATPARRAQIVVKSEAARLGAGAPLRIEAEATLNAPRQIANYAAWAQGGTAELRRLVLADASGEIARFAGTAVPDGRGGLNAAGTVETVCPAAVRALLSGGAATSEQRLRRPVRIAWRGQLSETPALSPPEAPEVRGPRRGQEPPCPVLRA